MLLLVLKVRVKCAGVNQGGGKSSGVRIIYFNITKAGVVLLVTLYAKKVKTNITANEIHEVLNHE